MRSIAFSFTLLLTFFGHSQKNAILDTPEVDQRIELLSIVFRLAECHEYSINEFPRYVKRIEDHFTPYKNHPLIKFTKSKVRKQGVGYDAVMFMAIAISQPPVMKPLKPFTKNFPEERWGQKTATKFLELLNEFYVDAKCADFFAQNQSLFLESSANFKPIYDELDLSWYEQFYGSLPTGKFKIINALSNGAGNYGPSVTVGNDETIYAIMGTWNVDDSGMPSFKRESYFPTMLHEFNHSFINHVVEKFHEQLEASGETIFPVVKKRMNRQAYQDWKTMYAESLVRAAVIKYLKDHDYPEDFIHAETAEQLERGFIWTNQLVEELDRYDRERNTYPDLESFMPEIVRFFEETANNIHDLDKTLDQQRPWVVEIKPFSNGAINVDPSLKQIKIVFDRPLTGKGYSINYGKKGKKLFPKIEKVTFSENRSSVFIDVQLEPNHTYEMVLTGRSFKSMKHKIGMKNFSISFKTKK